MQVAIFFSAILVGLAWAEPVSLEARQVKKYCKPYREDTHEKFLDFLKDGLKWQYDQESYMADKCQRQIQEYSSGVKSIKKSGSKTKPPKKPAGGAQETAGEPTHKVRHAKHRQFEPSTSSTTHCKRGGASCMAARTKIRMVQSSQLRGFRLPTAAGGRAGFLLVAPYAFQALHAVAESGYPAADVVVCSTMPWMLSRRR